MRKRKNKRKPETLRATNKASGLCSYFFQPNRRRTGMPFTFDESVKVYVDWHGEQIEVIFISRLDSKYMDSYDTMGSEQAASLPTQDASSKEIHDGIKARRASVASFFDKIVEDVPELDKKNPENWREEIPFEFKDKAVSELLDTDKLQEKRVKN